MVNLHFIEISWSWEKPKQLTLEFLALRILTNGPNDIINDKITWEFLNGLDKWLTDRCWDDKKENFLLLYFSEYLKWNLFRLRKGNYHIV